MAELDRIDSPALATALGQRMRAAGVPATPERAARFARALALVGPIRRPELYWTARSVFVSSQAQLPTFDRVATATRYLEPHAPSSPAATPHCRWPGTSARDSSRHHPGSCICAANQSRTAITTSKTATLTSKVFLIDG